MRIAFFGTWSRYSFLHLEAAAGATEVVGVVEGGELARARKDPDFLRGPLAPLRRRMLAHSPWRWARDRGLPALWWRKDQLPAIEAALRAWAPDLGVVASFPGLLPERFLEIPRLGFINVHASLLPQFPGPDPILWHYLAGATEGGMSINRIVAQEDGGSVLAQEAVPIPPLLPLGEYRERLMAVGPRLLARTLEGLASGQLPEVAPRPAGPILRARRVKPLEPVLDWTLPLERVAHALIGVLESVGLPDLDPRYAWSVAGLAPGPAEGTPGTLGRDGEGYFLRHPGGRIRLARHRDWTARTKARILKSLL